MRALLFAAAAASAQGGSVAERPAWALGTSTFAISAAEGAAWYDPGTGAVIASPLSPAGASYTRGTNGLTRGVAGEIGFAGTGKLRRSYDTAASAWTYELRDDVPVLSNGAPAPPQVLGIDPDSGRFLNFATGAVSDWTYVIDADNGDDDANDGSATAPFQTWGPAWAAVVASSAEEIRILVKRPASGVYQQQHWSWAVDGMGGSTVWIVYEPDITCTWAPVPVDSAGNPVASREDPAFVDFGLGAHAYGAATEAKCPIYARNGTVYVYGNGALSRGYLDLGSAQTLGGAGNSTVYAFDLHSVDTGDGISGHNASDTINAYRCTFRDFFKVGYANVGGSSGYCEDCLFAGTGAMLNPNAIGTHTFLRTRFLPTASAGWNANAACSFTACQIGDESTFLNMTGGTYTDCWVNARMYGPAVATFIRCFGHASIRMRAGHALTIDKGALTGPADGTAFIIPFSSDSTYGTVTVTDTILTGYGTGVQLNNSTEAAKWQASGSSLNGCLLFGNGTNFDSAAAGQVGSTITNTDTSTDPLLPAYAGSYQQADYVPGAGAAGFTSGDVVATGPRMDVPCDWFFDAAGIGLSNGDVIRFTAADDTTEDVTVAAGILAVPTGAWASAHGPI
ncbi:hypothetical protein [Citreimonas sp.]|uniref:hypothetical protein n=1 Tax=Citreimonas sp. TaxID=3036715 RepID=UPI0035C8797C